MGPTGIYEWAVYFLNEWRVDCDHIHCFNMDEWSDASGNTLPRGEPGSFEDAMLELFYEPLGSHTVPAAQRNFATKENLPQYEEKIAALKAKGAKLITVFGIGRAFHIAFWEPHFGADYETDEAWSKATHRIGAQLHPLTVEQNAIYSFKSNFTAVPCRANTIGPGLFLKSDYIIGGCDGVFDRGASLQGVSLWVTLRHGPTRWIASSYMPTMPGRLFFEKRLAGPMDADIH